MRRLGSTFVTLWIAMFVPSLIIWGLMVRWSEAGTDRFEAVWQWLANLLAFPIIFSSLTNWSWRALAASPPLGATLGFVILVAVWALMLSAPLIFVAGWWVLIAQRLSGSSSASGGLAGGAGPITVPYSIPSSLHSPSRALYLITLPLAMLWTGVRRLTDWMANARMFWTMAILFAATLGMVTVFFALLFGLSSYPDRFAAMEWATRMWFGYLETFHIPHLFQTQWVDARRTIYDHAYALDFEEWPDYMGSWYRHAEFRTLVWTTGVRHGLAVVLAYLGYSLVRRLFR